MADNDKIVTKESLREFYNQIQPYLNGGANTGYTPVGTVISIMGNEAPQHYLKCDGSIYNIVDYEELANHFATQFGSSNFFGGNGTTTFAVPDLRGEFLRGTGTNSHENQGDGANVGEHQDGSVHSNVYTVENATGAWAAQRGQSNANNPDKVIGGTLQQITSTKTTATNLTATYTSRPTNTSVLYCIATKDIYIDARCDYSTSEKVVGTWIDGKPLYQKTIDCGALPNNTTKSVTANIGNNIVDRLVNVNGSGYDPSSYITITIPFVNNVTQGYSLQVVYNASTDSIQLRTGANLSTYTTSYVTIQYTKTTD